MISRREAVALGASFALTPLARVLAQGRASDPGLDAYAVNLGAWWDDTPFLDRFDLAAVTCGASTAARAVIRLPADSSREYRAPPVLTTSEPFRHVISGSLSLISLILTWRDLVTPFPIRSPPRLLGAAAMGGLKPPSERRLRGTYPHLHHSTACLPGLRSWHTPIRCL